MFSIKCTFYCEVYTILDTDKLQKLIILFRIVQQLCNCPWSLFSYLLTQLESLVSLGLSCHFSSFHLLLSALLRRTASCLECIWFTVTFVLFCFNFFSQLPVYDLCKDWLEPHSLIFTFFFISKIFSPSSMYTAYLTINKCVVIR